MGLVELPSGNSISLFVDAASGHDQAPPIFFVHGLSNDHTVLANLIVSLSRRMRIAFDLPGHCSSPLYSPLNLTGTLVHDCQALLSHAGVKDEVDIVAHSVGTVVALALAATLGARVRTGSSSERLRSPCPTSKPRPRHSVRADMVSSSLHKSVY